MSFHKNPAYNNDAMHSYMKSQGLKIDEPSMVSDAFRLGWVAAMDYTTIKNCATALEDAGDDYRLSSATRKEWAERALKAEERVKELEAQQNGDHANIDLKIERVKELEAELKEARMQSLSDAGQAQEAYERQLELETERDRLRDALNALCGNFIPPISHDEVKRFARAALNTDGDT